MLLTLCVHPALCATRHPTLMSFVELFSPSPPRAFLAAVTFEDFDSSHVQQFWDALNNFTSGERPLSFSSPTGPGLRGPFFPWECPLALPGPEGDPSSVPCPFPEDLSRFLKFVTGRSRLPVQLTIYPDRSM